MTMCSRSQARSGRRINNSLTQLFILFAMLSATASLAAEVSRIPSLEDFMALEIVTSAEISPRGDRVAFATFTNDFENDKDMSQL